MKAALVALAVAAAWPSGAAAEPVTEAEIRFVEGPGPAPLQLTLRGGRALLVESVGLERAAGVYRVDLPPADPIFAALARLPEKIEGPPLVPDSPVVWLSLHTAAGARTLTAPRPSTDPRVAALLTEVQHLAQRARAHPVGTVALSVRPPRSPRSATLHLAGGGPPEVEIRLHGGTPHLETTALPAAADPGVTPLPPAWTAATAKTKPLDLRLKGGGQRDLPVPVTLPRPPYGLRATFTGTLTVREKGQPDVSGPVELSSPPLEVRAAK